MGIHEPSDAGDEREIEAQSTDLPVVSPPADATVHSLRFDLVGNFGGRMVNRRRVLTTSAGLAASGLALGRLGAQAQDATPAGATPSAGMAGHDMEDMEVSPPTNLGFTNFVPYQAAIIQAAAARLIPTDELGPGATEAGVVYFIDRQLSKEKMGFRGKEYDLGPFVVGEPTQGDQSALPVRDRFRVGIFAMDNYAREKFGKGFVECSAEEQDEVLSDLEQGIPENFGGTALQAQPLPTDPTFTQGSSMETNDGVRLGADAFFTLLRTWTLAGFFCDPAQGGNRDMVGWKLIGFPGAQISYFDHIENYDVPFEGEFISLGQYQEQVGGGI